MSSAGGGLYVLPFSPQPSYFTCGKQHKLLSLIGINGFIPECGLLLSRLTDNLTVHCCTPENTEYDRNLKVTADVPHFYILRNNLLLLSLTLILYHKKRRSDSMNACGHTENASPVEPLINLFRKLSADPGNLADFIRTCLKELLYAAHVLEQSLTAHGTDSRNILKP